MYTYIRIYVYIRVYAYTHKHVYAQKAEEVQVVCLRVCVRAFMRV